MRNENEKFELQDGQQFLPHLKYNYKVNSFDLIGP